MVVGVQKMPTKLHFFRNAFSTLTSITIRRKLLQTYYVHINSINPLIRENKKKFNYGIEILLKKQDLVNMKVILIKAVKRVYHQSTNNR